MSVKIKRGSILLYRIFDIAEEINIPLAQSTLQDLRGADSFNVPKFIDRGIVMKSRPVAFGLGEQKIHLKGKDCTATVLGKVRDYGVLSLIYEIKLDPGISWGELISFAADLEEGSEIDQIAQKQARDVAERLSPALKKQPNEWKIFEDYIIYALEEFEEGVSARDLPQRADVAALLLAEDNTKISHHTRTSILENLYQYGEDDLAYVEWNSALVVEPKGGREVPDILEFALIHLLEMRYYDDLLDKRLGSLYDDIERSKGRSSLRGQYAQIYQEASSRYIEFSEFIERVENSLKVVGDFYLATIYRAANRRFRLADWQQNITRKMSLLAQVSSLLQGELNMRRSHWLEIIIIVLIAFEIVSALLKIY
jgi:hypothetical protein